MQNDTLIARLEAATGPDRELDCFIWALSKGIVLEWKRDLLFAGVNEGVIGWVSTGEEPRFSTNRTERGYISSIPAYTASIDAALTLVRDGSPKAIFDVLRTAALWWTQYGLTDIADLPRFICIAALKAKEVDNG